MVRISLIRTAWSIRVKDKIMSIKSDISLDTIIKVLTIVACAIGATIYVADMKSNIALNSQKIESIEKDVNFKYELLAALMKSLAEKNHIDADLIKAQVQAKMDTLSKNK